MCEVVEIERVGNDAFKLFIYIHDTVSNIVFRFRICEGDNSHLRASLCRDL